MIIGNFTYTKAKDTYMGDIHTLTLLRSKVIFRPVAGKTGKVPDYVVIVESATGAVELGAAWKRTSEAGRDFLSVSIDDPALDHPLNAALIPAEDGKGAILIWARAKKREAQAA